MAITIDPHGKHYVEGIIFTGGPNQGRSIGEVARTDEGILYLGLLAECPVRRSYLPMDVQEAILKFFSYPERTRALQLAQDRASHHEQSGRLP